METKKLVVNLPKDIHQALKTVAFFRNLSMTDIVIETLKDVIEEEKKKGNIPEVRKQA